MATEILTIIRPYNYDEYIYIWRLQSSNDYRPYGLGPCPLRKHPFPDATAGARRATPAATLPPPAILDAPGLLRHGKDRRYSFTNPEFSQILNRRFLNQNYNANFGVIGDKCGIHGCTVLLTDAHLEACVRSGILTARSEALKSVVLEIILEYAGVSCDSQDCKFNKGL